MQEERQYQVIEKTEKKTVLKIENETGDAVFTAYEVFPGVELVFDAVHINKCHLGMGNSGNFIVIQHCKEGRMENAYGDEYFYLSAGDLAVIKRHDFNLEYEFPLRHYHGIAIAIDVDKAPKCFSCFIKDVDIRPSTIADRLCGEKGCYIARSEQYVEHIFSELYSVPDSIRDGYFKVKILELLLVLSGIQTEAKEESGHRLHSEQVRLAKEIKAFLSENMDRRITITELAEQFYVSESQIKNVFKAVYGVPVFSFMRVQKMQAAALQLIHSDRPITDIALDFGYDNASKFSSAFKEIMGDTPVQYRKDHRQYN